MEDLYRLLSHAKQTMPDVQAVSSGAIASDYQRLRVEHVRQVCCTHAVLHLHNVCSSPASPWAGGKQQRCPALPVPCKLHHGQREAYHRWGMGALLPN